MQGLARFAMSGRYRALLLAVASSGSLLFAWIGAAVVALVMLRKGSREGLWLVLWASLPALLVTRVSGDSSALAMLLGTAVLALVLRASMSLALTAVASAGVALVTGLGLLAFGQSMLAELSALFAQFFAALETQTLEAGGESLGLQPPTLPQLAGMMGTANGALSFLCLALARYWQAELYNPSGFGSEFRELQLPKTLVWALVLAAVSLSAAGLAFRSWGAAMLLPVTVAGFALLHARARHRGQGSFWMSGIYVAWLVFDAAKLGLVGLVLADTMMNFRHRWQGTVPSEADDDSNTEQEQDVGDDDDHQDDTKD
ncbi:MAG: hypothetical protein ACI8RN_002539 [Glaciecola sp.]|jgi:hypothetical protein